MSIVVKSLHNQYTIMVILAHGRNERAIVIQLLVKGDSFNKVVKKVENGIKLQTNQAICRQVIYKRFGTILDNWI